MKLSSSNGTNLTMEQLKNTRKVLGDCFERIIEINASGTQFDFCTCPELSNEVNSINEIMGKITKVVFQER